ncbi:MAG: anti-sigma factor [Myxococcales bacterium]|nr:anti-sigma factor [Myxococcales bacterium]
MTGSKMTAVMLLGLVAACEGDTTPDTPDNPDAANTLRWDLQGLETLGAGYVYEGWVVVDGAPVSTGRFGVAADGTPDLDSFELSEDQLAGLEAFVLSIEPETGDDPAPSDVKLLGGDLDDTGAGDLSVAHGAALGDDLTSAMGGYILETPSSNKIPEDYNQGLWFLDPAGGPGPALTLPTLPSGWVYEGWVVDADGPISTGRFTSAEGADSDGGGPEAGPDGTPPFPGQDYIQPAMDLVGLTVVISVEPQPDDSPAPFVLKPLVDGEVEDVGGGVVQDLANNADATNPTGSVWIE